MKDALGHGSNQYRTNSMVAMAGGARFTPAPRPVSKPSTNDRVADLRQRLAAPKQGLLHSFAQGLRSAFNASDS